MHKPKMPIRRNHPTNQVDRRPYSIPLKDGQQVVVLSVTVIECNNKALWRNACPVLCQDRVHQLIERNECVSLGEVLEMFLQNTQTWVMVDDNPYFVSCPYVPYEKR